MPNTQIETSKKTEVKTSHDEPNLKGTFIAVMALGAFLIITWFTVWGLFIAR